MCSVSACGYRPMHNPPLEVCCSFIDGQLVQGPPAALQRNVWTKNLSPPRVFYSRQETKVENFYTHLADGLLSKCAKHVRGCGGVSKQTTKVCQRVEATKLFITRALPLYDSCGSNHFHLDDRAHFLQNSFPVHRQSSKASLLAQFTYADEVFSYKCRVFRSCWTSFWSETKTFMARLRVFDPPGSSRSSSLTVVLRLLDN